MVRNIGAMAAAKWPIGVEDGATVSGSHETNAKYFITTLSAATLCRRFIL
jgi:hypothetical protein